jgi:hypothetical protein
MNRKRAWEIGAAVALTASLAGAAFLFQRQEHQSQLDRELAAAAFNGDHASLGRALALGADPNSTTRGPLRRPLVSRQWVGPGPAPVNPSPLILSIRRRDARAVSRLLEAGGDPNQPDPTFLRPPLLWAVDHGNPEIVRALLRHGADPNRGSPWVTVGAFRMRPETPLDSLHTAGVDEDPAERRSLRQIAVLLRDSGASAGDNSTAATLDAPPAGAEEES